MESIIHYIYLTVNLKFGSMKQYITKLINKKILTSNILELEFTKPNNFKFSAGQFIQFCIPDKPVDIVRSYSIASAPNNDNLKFCIKIYEEGKASTFFSEMKIGGEAKISDALGKFVYCDSTSQDFFVATGTGIAPIYAIINDLLIYKKITKKIHLLFGVRYEQDIFWKKELELLSKEYNNFSLEIILSRALNNWNGHVGHVTDYIKNKDNNGNYYICGSGSMVKDVRTLLINKGVTLEKIHFEIF